MELYFNELILYAIKNECSDIHLDFINNKCFITFRYKGFISSNNMIEINDNCKLYNYILFKANLDILNKNILHTGTIKILDNEKQIFLRVSVIPTFEQRSIVIRILNNKQMIDLDKISLIKNNTKKLNSILNQKDGLILFCGKTGAGKTTTLYSLINKLIKQTNKKIITLEDPIETKIEGVLQINVNREVMTFFDVFKQVLRHDPDVIVIGEIRDEGDLKLAVQAALSGHLVLSSMHSMNAKNAINRLIDLKVNKFDLKAILNMIAYQELIYTSHKIYSIYEFLTSEQIINLLNNKNVEYKTIAYYKEKLKRVINFNEGK